MQVGCLTACLQLLSQDLTLRMSPYEDTQACHTVPQSSVFSFRGKMFAGVHKL
jgi:hypothetical protein